MPDARQGGRRVALVTGASRGIGRAIALALGRDHDVAVAYRARADEADAVVAALERQGARAVAIARDLTDPDTPVKLIEDTLSAFGRVDTVVANAGVFIVKPFLDTTPDELELQMTVNATAGYRLAQAGVSWMVAHDVAGSVTFVASAAGVRPRAHMSAYSISKAAVVMMTRVLAKELGPTGVRVNAVAPGTIETDLNRDQLATAEGRERLLATTVLPRPGEPEDVAEAVAFLASQRAAFVTGAVLGVDGGSSLS